MSRIYYVILGRIIIIFKIKNVTKMWMNVCMDGEMINSWIIWL